MADASFGGGVALMDSNKLVANLFFTYTLPSYEYKEILRV